MRGSRYLRRPRAACPAVLHANHPGDFPRVFGVRLRHAPEGVRARRARHGTHLPMREERGGARDAPPRHGRHPPAAEGDGDMPGQTHGDDVRQLDGRALARRRPPHHHARPPRAHERAQAESRGDVREHLRFGRRRERPQPVHPVAAARARKVRRALAPRPARVRHQSQGFAAQRPGGPRRGR